MRSRTTFYFLYASRLIGHTQATKASLQFSVRLLCSVNNSPSPESNLLLLAYHIFLKLTSFKPFLSPVAERYVFNNKLYKYTLVLDLSSFYSSCLFDVFSTFLIPAVCRRNDSIFAYGRDFYDVSITDISVVPYFGSYIHSFAVHFYFKSNFKQFFSLFQLT